MQAVRSFWGRLWNRLPSLFAAEKLGTLTKGGRHSGRRCRLQLEALESRELLNSAPIAHDSSLSLVHDQLAWVSVSYSDPDGGDSVSVSGYSQPTHGSVTFDGIDQFTYTPAILYLGEDSFTFTVTDGLATATGTVYLTVTNQTPLAYDSSISLLHNQTAVFTATYSDPDIEPVYVNSYSQPAHGTLVFEAINQFTYTPAVGYVGSDSFTFTVSDGIAVSTSATIFLSVTNTAPEVYGGSMDLTHNQSASFWPSSYDADGDQVSVSGYTQAAHGSVTFDGQNFTYTPATGYVGEDGFTYSMTDGIDTTTANVLLTITNQTPTIADTSLSLLHDQPASIWPSYYDPDYGDTVTISGYTQPAHGTVTDDGMGGLIYTPATGYVGEDSFTITVSDGIATATGTVSLTVTNQAPTISDTTLSLLHDQSTSVWPMYSDPDYGDTVTISGYTQPAHGTVTDDGMGGLLYTPATGYVGEDSFTVTASDGIASTTATVYLTITDQAPTVYDSNLGLIHDRYYSIWPTLSDPDYGDSVTVSSWTSTAHGSLTYDSVSQYFSYMPDAGYTGADSFSYSVSDGAASSTASVYLTITNQAPTAGDDSFAVEENGSLTDNVLMNDGDIDGDRVQASLMSSPAVGILTSFDSDGSFSYEPPEDYFGTVTFSYQATDGLESSAPATVTIVVNRQALTMDLDGKSADALPGDDYVSEAAEDDTGVYVADAQATTPAQLLALATGMQDYKRTLTWDDTQVAVYDAGTPVSSGVVLDEAAGDKVFTVVALAGFDPDSFQTVTMEVQDGQNQFVGLDSIRLTRISIRLEMDGVAQGGNRLVGGYVPINADNDNGSQVNDGIPVTRDFDVVNQAVAAENDLVRVRIILPAGALPGTFVLSIPQGSDHIRLWDTATKTNQINPGTFTQATLPQEFYVEGIKPSETERDIQISLRYFSFNLPQIALGGDLVKATVTPVLSLFHQAAGQVTFTNGVNGYIGLTARGTGADNPGGTIVDAQVTRTSLNGALVFVQNIVNVVNGDLDDTTGWELQFPANFPNPLTAQMNTVPQAGVTFPILDAPPGAATPYYPSRSIINNASTQLISMVDNPESGAPSFPAGHPLAGNTAGNFLTHVDVRYDFVTYVVWKFAPERGQEILYPFAFKNWSVQFNAIRDDTIPLPPNWPAGPLSVNRITASAVTVDTDSFQVLGPGATVTMVLTGPRGNQALQIG